MGRVFYMAKSYVVYREDKNAEPINPPLAIPANPPSTPLHTDIKYKDEPVT